MWDYFHLANDSLGVQTFYQSVGYQIWNKPRGTKMVSMFLVGAGGNGGAGFSGAPGNKRGGGGGGGSGAITKIDVPACLLPDKLMILNMGGFATMVVSSMGDSVSILATANQGGDGGAGTTNATGAAGTGGQASTSGLHASLGTIVSYAGVTGGAGGVISGGQAPSVTAAFSFPLSGGAGGGSTPESNTNYAGGNVNSTYLNLLPTIQGGAAGGGAGRAGTQIMTPFTCIGGSGGGTNGASGTGGTGGNGGYGSGGGGGGAGVTGGAGGRGGEGLVIIISL